MGIELLMVALGGSLGCVLRYLVEHFNIFGDKFINIISINIIGCFLIGLLFVVANNFNATWFNRFFITGLLGGFTTFSTFALQTLMLTKEHELIYSVGYVVLSVVVGIIACYIGGMLGNKILSL